MAPDKVVEIALPAVPPKAEEIAASAAPEIASPIIFPRPAPASLLNVFDPATVLPPTRFSARLCASEKLASAFSVSLASSATSLRFLRTLS